MLELPELGDIYESREELNVLIKSASRELGYLVKQSITSERAVRWYCSEKYSSIRCLGGFRANFQEGQWYVTEATEHHEACTRARQRVKAARAAMPDVKCPKVAKCNDSDPPAAAIAGPAVKSYATPPRPGLRPSNRYSSHRRLTVTSPANSASPPSSPPSFVIDGPFNKAGLSVPAVKKRRRSSTSSSTTSAAAAKAVRERSQSASSWYSYTSEQSAEEVTASYAAIEDGETRTILDPAHHFKPQSSLLGVPQAGDGQSMTMLRRKRSWSGSRVPYVGYGLP